MIRKYTSSQSEIQCNSASTSIFNTRVYIHVHVQDQATPEADRGSGEGGGLSHWQRTSLHQTGRLVYVSTTLIV